VTGKARGCVRGGGGKFENEETCVYRLEAGKVKVMEVQSKATGNPEAGNLRKGVGGCRSTRESQGREAIKR